MPVRGSKSKTVCCLCCASGPLTVDARIERKGYSPGDQILVAANFENNSSRLVAPVAKLIQVVTYHARGGWKKEHNEHYKYKGQ